MVLGVFAALMLNTPAFRAAVHNLTGCPRVAGKNLSRRVAAVTAIEMAAFGLDSGRKIGLTNFRKIRN